MHFCVLPFMLYVWDSANVVFMCSQFHICPDLLKAGIALQDQIAVVQPFWLRNLHNQVVSLRVYSNVVFSFPHPTPPLPLMAVLTCVINLVHTWHSINHSWLSSESRQGT